MLQRALSSGEPRFQPVASAPPEAGLGDTIGLAVQFLRRRYLAIIVALLAALAGAVAYLRVTPPSYVAVAQVLLDSPKSQLVKQDSPLADTTVDLAHIETQMQILRSPALAMTVIHDLGLEQDPDLNARSFSVFALARDLRDRVWPSREPLSPEAPSVTPPQLEPFLARLDIRRVGYGDIVEVAYAASGPAHAAEVANAVANAYVADQKNTKIAASRQATGWLQERLQDLGARARVAEQEADAYKAQHNLVSSGGKPIDEQQIADLNTRLVAASAQASEAQAHLNRFEAILNGDWSKGPSVATMGAAESDSLSNPIINGLRTQYLDLERRENEWATRYGPTHQAVVELRTRLNGLRQSIREEIKRLAETSRNDYEVAVKRRQAIETLLNGAVAQSRRLDPAEAQLREMEARARDYRGLYQTFQQRYLSAVQTESFPISDARVVSPALPPDSKSKPKKGLVLALGALGGLALGLSFGLLREMTDGVFRTSGQVEQALGLRCLSVTPRVRKARRAGKLPAAAAAARTVSRGHAIDAAVTTVPLSRYVEAIRAIKLGVDLGPARREDKVIGLTSALPNEGKSTLAASLAQLIAHGGKRVIVVDCDLRNPSLSRDFAPSATAGLLEVVSGERALEDVIWRDPASSLSVLPAVHHRALFHTAEALSSDAMQKLFDQLRDSYDYVIVDLPPLTPLMDARAACAFVDSFVLVVEWGRTRVEVVRRALANAPCVRDNIVGAVLNKTDMKAMALYDARSRDLYDDRHFARYGARKNA